MSAPQILCDLIYPTGELSHGGRHRSLQLRELVESAELEPIVIAAAERQSNVAHYARGLRAALGHRMPVAGWRWLLW